MISESPFFTQSAGNGTWAVAIRCAEIAHELRARDSLIFDVVEHAKNANAKATLWLLQPPQPLDATLALRSRAVLEMRIDGVSHLGPVVCG